MGVCQPWPFSVSRLIPPEYRNHVILDLQPYICVFDECSLPDQSFDNKEDWLQHERWSHNVSWSCDGFNTHPPSTFHDRGEFQLHFKKFHSAIFSSPDIDRLVEVSATPSSRMFDHCPFCDFTVHTETGFRTKNTVSVSLLRYSSDFQDLEHIAKNTIPYEIAKAG